jgi:succinylglutamate desuccinylase
MTSSGNADQLKHRLHFKSVNYSAPQAGTRLIVTAAVHGNETCGTRAIERVMARLESGQLAITRGSLTLVPVTNPLAYALGQRMGDRNLNRCLFPTSAPQDFEDRVANWLCPLLAQHDVLIDLHSYLGAPPAEQSSGEANGAPNGKPNGQPNGEPFVMVGPRNNDGTLEPFAQSTEERALARRLGVRRVVDGWLATYGQGVIRRMRSLDHAQIQKVLRYGVGTTEYMRTTGGYALTLECGQHDDPAAVDVAERAILNALAFLKLIEAPAPEPVPAHEMEALSLVAVYDKEHDDDVFVRPWASFDPVRKGELIGHRASGAPVFAEFDGRILFPDRAAKAGHEWYYLTRENPEFERQG